jgi:hypothetical protein
VFPDFLIPIVYDAVTHDNAGLADLAILRPADLTTGIWFVHFSACLEDVTDMVEAFLRLGGVTDYGRVTQGNSRTATTGHIRTDQHHRYPVRPGNHRTQRVDVAVGIHRTPRRQETLVTRKGASR